MKTWITIVLTFLNLISIAQGPVGSWSDHLPYRSVKYIALGNEEIFGSTDYAISVYNINFNELHKLSKVNGLSDCGISTIGFSKEYSSLIIAYTSSNIDIFKDNVVTNIPDIYNKYVTGPKQINRIRTYGKYAYMATSFGIVLIDLAKTEIRDTWKPSDDGSANEVYDLTLAGDKIYAVTAQGLFKGNINNQGLSYFDNWEKEASVGSAGLNAIASIGDLIFVNKKGKPASGDSIFLIQNNSITQFSNLPGVSNYTFETGSDKLVVSSGSLVTVFNESGEVDYSIESYGWAGINAVNAITDGNDIYIADLYNGIVKGTGHSTFTSYIPPGPYNNNCSNIYSEKGSVYVAGGLLDNIWNNTWRSFQMFIFEDRKWKSFLPPSTWDVMRIRPHPDDKSRIFVSTWGSGLYEFSGNDIINHWDDSNSPLPTIIPGAKYVRICGLAFDRNNNLWITQTGVENSIKVLTYDGDWIVLPYTIDAPTIGDIIITRTGMKWIVLPRGHGLYVLDDNNTPAIFNDDRYKKLNVKDQDGNPLPNVYSISEDLDGNIWIGTDQGPAVYYNRNTVFDNDIYAYRVKIARNDGTGLADYLLETETITSISVDGGNRKWFGTISSGVFLVSEDGKELIRNYNESNSPVLSNIISGTAIDGTTGEVWIGTDKGLVTVRESATDGAETMEKVYAFPNPVREDFNGEVVITGLQRNSRVKITDISGNLVFETNSTGGQATWNLSNYRGDRVSTGVYIILCSAEDASSTAITKLLVVR